MFLKRSLRIILTKIQELLTLVVRFTLLRRPPSKQQQQQQEQQQKKHKNKGGPKIDICETLHGLFVKLLK